MSGTSLHVLRYREEASYGVDPGVQLVELNHINWGVVEAINLIDSGNIIANRHPSAKVPGGRTVQGPYVSNLAFDTNQNKLIRASMMFDVAATSSTNWNSQTTIAFSAVTNTIDDTTGVFRFVSGDWILCTGSPLNGTGTRLEFIAKVAVGFIVGTLSSAAAIGALVGAAGTWPQLTSVTPGSIVTGLTSGATGEFLALSGGGLTYALRVISGAFNATEVVQLSTSLAAGLTTDKVTLATVDTSGGVLSGIKVATEAAAAVVSVKRLGAIFPGNTQKSLHFEGQQSDLSGAYEHYSGAMIRGWTITVPPEVKCEISFDLSCKDRVINTATVGVGLHIAADTHQFFTTELNFFAFYMSPGGEGTLHAMTATSADATTICTTAAKHNLQTGDLICISGNGDTDNNRNWLVTRISDTTFSLQGSTAQTAQTTNSGVFRVLKQKHTMVNGSFSFANNLRRNTNAGDTGPSSQPLGTFEFTASLNRYLATMNDQRRYHDNEPCSMAFIFQDTATDPSSFMIFEMIAGHYTEAPSPVDGPNNDRVTAVQASAEIDSSQLKTFGYWRS